MSDLSFDRRAVRDGMIAILPLGIPGLPFGFVLGLLIQEEGLPQFAGWASSWIIFAGSSQLAALTLLAEGTAGAFIVLSIFLINSRHLMYSAALRRSFAEYPRWARFVGPYLLIDQTFALASTAPELEQASSRYRLWHFLGSGIVVWSTWQLSTASGILVGNVVREEWMLTFAVPVMFLGLLVLSIKNRPGVVAGFVGAGVALLGRDLPQGSGLMIAIVAGMVAGVVAERSLDASDQGKPSSDRASS